MIRPSLSTIALAAAVLAPPALAGQAAPDQTASGAVAMRAAVVPASTAVPMDIPELKGAVTIDGKVDEAAWDAIAPLPLVMVAPTPGGQPTERTEIRVAHDADYLYLSARMYDSRPGGVHGNSLRRDRWSGDDTFELILDTFDDKQTAAHFVVMPAGARMDEQIQGDADGDGAFQDAWNAFWDARATITPSGWFAEMRIPFSSLRFQSAGGRVRMGLTTFRYITRKSEFDAFPRLPANRKSPQFRPSLAQEVTLQGVAGRRPVYVTPYVLGGMGTAAALNAAGSAYRSRNDATHEAGLDLKYGLTSNLTLDLTANTDFAQVDADDEQVNLTRYSLFLPERRPFFLERAGIFDFGTGGSTGLFYSRRIGLSPSGQPLRILGGARIGGRAGAWDVGALEMQTAGRDSTQGENFGVVRVRRQVLNPFSYAGGIFTSRIAADGRYNVAYGTDASVRVGASRYLDFAWAQSFEPGSERGPGRSGQLRASLVERRIVGLNGGLEVQWAGRDFDPGLGYQTYQDFSRLGWRLDYGWQPKAGPLQRITASFSGDAVARNPDRSLLTGESFTEVRATTRTGLFAVAGTWHQVEDLREAFEPAAGSTIAPGRYTWDRAYAHVELPSGWKVRATGEIGVGGFYDGRRLGLDLLPTWNVSPHLELGGGYHLNHVTFPGRPGFDSHVAQASVLAALDTRLSASLRGQYNSLRGTLGTSARVRYNMRDGDDLFVVYDEGYNTDRVGTSPALPLSDHRRLVLKLTHTFGR
jgi:hypothetical protein